MENHPKTMETTKISENHEKPPQNQNQGLQYLYTNTQWYKFKVIQVSSDTNTNWYKYKAIQIQNDTNTKKYKYKIDTNIKWYKCKVIQTQSDTNTKVIQIQK